MPGTPPTTPGPLPSGSAVGSFAVRLVVRGGVALVIVALGVTVMVALAKQRKQPTATGTPPAPLLVSVVPAALADLPPVWTGYGTARAMRSADVAAQLNARVVQRPESIEPGAAVRRGDVLVVLDDADARAREAGAVARAASAEAELARLDAEKGSLGDQVSAASADLAVAERDLARAREALAAGAGSPSELDARAAAVNRARLTLEALRERGLTWEPRRQGASAARDAALADAAAARLDVERTRVTSPIDGVLASVGPRVGDLLAPGAAVARVVDLSLVEVPLRLPSAAAGSVRAGDALSLNADGQSDRAWAARLTRVSPEADAGSRTITVYAEVSQAGATPGDAAALLPGRFVTGRVVGHAEGPALVVPRRAIDRDFVFVAAAAGTAENGGGATVSRVRVGVVRFAAGRLPGLDAVETEWAVLEPSAGLAAGTPVITSNLDQLTDGLIVRTARAEVEAEVGAGVERGAEVGP